jgi:hypothetical protein
VLFSSADIAEYVNAGFEPVWESVRPVPIVTIDFGNGLKVTRTLHGNVATSVCNADGNVLDVLPGIYKPDEYRKQLEQFVLLYRYSRPTPKAPAAETLKAYHARQAEHLKAEQAADVLVYNARADMSKLRVENPIKLLAAADASKVLQRDPVTGAFRLNRPGDAKPPAPASPPPSKVAEVSGWKELAEDTRINETLRRRQIHEKLAATGPVPPKDLVKWLYKDVLHTDLDDPMLGLGEVLNKNYPFTDEDRKPVAP